MSAAAQPALSKRRIVELCFEPPVPKDESLENRYRFNLLRSLRYRAFREVGPEHAEDVLSTAILEALASAHTLHSMEPRSVASWIGAVFHYTCLEHIRQRVRQRKNVADELPLEDAADFIPDEMGDGGTYVYRKQRGAIAAELLGLLPTNWARILRLFYIEEKTPQEVMADMGLTKTQFRLMKSRAKARLTALCAARVQRRAA